MRLFVATIFAVISFTASAFAIDFTQTLKDFDGNEFKDQNGQPAPMVLGTVIENALMSERATIPDDERKQRFLLALRLHEHAKDYAPTPDEVVMMKKALAVQPIVIMGQATRIIDPTWAK